MSIGSIALIGIFILVGIALIWFLVELAITVRGARRTIADVHQKLDPTLKNLDEITTDLKPAMKKVDPIADRAVLTLDAANLEIMRLDQILENVGDITDTASKATNAINTAASAPVTLVSNVANRVRQAFSPKYASDESVAISGDSRNYIDILDSGADDAPEAGITEAEAAVEPATEVEPVGPAAAAGEGGDAQEAAAKQDVPVAADDTTGNEVSSHEPIEYIKIEEAKKDD